MRIAFLDLDHTLLAADCNQLWMSYLQRHGLVSAGTVAAHERFIEDYARGVLDFPALQAFRHQVDADVPAAVLPAHRQAFAREVLLPALAPQAGALVAGLRAQGMTTVVVSATRAPLVDPVVDCLGIDHALTSCFGADKVRHVEAWLARQGQRLAGLEDSWFYSDSINDLPLLQAVRHPVAVDPDPRLEALARERGWEVLSLRAVSAA